MSNPLKGERRLTINGVDYHLKLTMNVIAQFQDMREKCFMRCAFESLAAAQSTAHIKNPIERAAVMASAVHLDDAATLIWLAAKEGNSSVEFAEIQEALIDDVDIDAGTMYPFIFADLCSFLISGKDSKKKDNSNNG